MNPYTCEDIYTLVPHTHAHTQHIHIHTKFLLKMSQDFSSPHPRAINETGLSPMWLGSQPGTDSWSLSNPIPVREENTQERRFRIFFLL